MDDSSPGTVTCIVKSIQDGDPTASERLLVAVYDELRALARSLMVRVPPGNTLQPTALVHEGYLRLVSSDVRDWKSRRYFFGAAAKAMRRILIEQARRKAAVKRGGDQHRLDVNEIDISVESPSGDIEALAESLDRLRENDPRKADVVELRYFAGLTMKETADVLGVSLPTVERDWRFARVVLFDELRGAD